MGDSVSMSLGLSRKCLPTLGSTGSSISDADEMPSFINDLPFKVQYW